MKQHFDFETKQAFSRFKRLQRRFKSEKNTRHLHELAKLDLFLSNKIIGWRKTYALNPW